MHKDLNPDRAILESKGEISYNPSCMSSGNNKILILKNDDIVAVFDKLQIDEQFDVYICASEAGEFKRRILIGGLLDKKFEHNLDIFLSKLEKVTSDHAIEWMLTFFIAHGFKEYWEVASKKGGDAPSDDELYFNAETARRLVKKAEEIKDFKLRNAALDWVLPLLPLDEALAKQAEREEAWKKGAK